MARKQTFSRTPMSRDMRWYIYEKSGRTCAHCGKALDFNKDFTVEHVIPLHKGGTNNPNNLIALCRTCNKEKSDNVIEPIKYYKYLPKDQLKELEALFEQYLAQTDWLAYDNLFRTDHEEFSVPVEQYLRTGKSVMIPVKFDIHKISAEEAFEWLQLYTARLKTEDKSVMASSPDDLKSPYYRVTNGDTTYMLCTAYAAPTGYGFKDSDVNITLHAVRIDMFTNPELINKPHLTPRLLYAGLGAVMSRIQDTLRRGFERESLIQCVVQYPASDTYGDKIFEYVNSCQPYFSPTSTYDEKNGPQPIHAQITWFHQGHNIKSLDQIDKRLTGTPEEIAEALLELQNPFRERLSDSILDDELA